MARATHPAARRPAFTLIELLVVIAIITVLMSLSAVAVFQLIGTQQTANTRGELNKVEVELQKQWRIAADKFAAEPIATSGQASAAYYQVIVPMAGTNERAKVIWVKMRLKQTFPQTFNEALNPTPLPPLTDYAAKLQALGYTAANTASPGYTPQPWESSVLLLMALQRGEEGAGVNFEALGVSSFIHDFPVPPQINPQQPLVKGLVDAWGSPLTFARWPVASTVLNPGGLPQAHDNNDPGDPSGLLESTSWQSSAGYTLFTQQPASPGLPYPIGHPLAPHPSGSAATSYRIFPLVASPGPDKQLGIDPITFAVQAAPQGNFSLDNVYPTIFPDK